MRRSQHAMGRGRTAGFTLVELVVALSMVTVMMTLLFGGLRLGARVWDTVEQRTDTLHDQQMIARFIMRELEQARPLTFAARDGKERLAFLGNADAVYFVAPLPSQAGGGGLHWVGLEVVVSEEAHRLVLSYELFQTNDWQRYDPQPRKRLAIYEKLADAEFDYFGMPGDSRQARWVATWDDPEKLPQLVRLRLKHEQADADWQELLAAPKLGISAGTVATRPHSLRRSL
jgi:general secretion pathway protein J